MTLQALPETLPARVAGGRDADVTIHVHDSFEAIEPIWDALNRDPRNSLHHGLAWCRAWIRTNPAPLLLVEGRLGDDTVFILPLAIERRRGTRVARFIAGSHSNLNTGLIAGDRPLLPPDQLLRTMREALSDKVDLLSLENMPLVWRERLSPFAALPHTANQNHAFQLPLRASFEETLKQVNAKRRRKKFRLQQRRLEEAGGYELLAPVTPEECHDVLNAFFRQKAERFRTQGLPDVFRDRPVQDFFHALLDSEARDDSYPLTLHALRLKGGVDAPILAIAGLSRKGDHIICQFGSIRDDIIPEASPGEFLFWHIIEGACQSGAALFDFGIGDQTYKRSWCTLETVQYDVLLALTPRGAIAAGLHRALVNIKAAIKGNKTLYSAIQRLRRGRAAPVADAATEDDQ